MWMLQRGRLISCALFALFALACARTHDEDDERPQRVPGASATAAVGGAAAGRDSEAARIGARAVATLEDVRGVTDPTEQIGGTATFTENALGVDLAFSMRRCQLNAAYFVAIQEGSDCEESTLRGERWDGARGEGLQRSTCGTTRQARVFYTRPKDDPKPWRIGEPADANLLGHALVVFEADSLEPVACGVIGREEDAVRPPKAPPGSGPSTEVRASIAGLCLGRMIVRDNEQACPDPGELAACATSHCEVDGCLETCADYVSCLGQASDVCEARFSCELTEACASCQSRVEQCAIGFCVEQLACAAPPAPDGPCAQLAACCMLQGDGAESCLDLVRTLEKLSGDPSCYGAMHDWDVHSHLAVPCQFE